MRVPTGRTLGLGWAFLLGLNAIASDVFDYWKHIRISPEHWDRQFSQHICCQNQDRYSACVGALVWAVSVARPADVQVLEIAAQNEQFDLSSCPNRITELLTSARNLALGGEQDSWIILGAIGQFSSQILKDPKLEFLPTAYLNDLREKTTPDPSYGIGVTCRASGICEIEEVEKDSEAAREGLRPGDQLLALDGKPLPTLTPWQLSQGLNLYQRKIELKVLSREGAVRLLTLEPRTRNALAWVKTEWEPSEKGALARVEIKSFESTEVCPEFKASIQSLLNKKDRRKGLILDLRGNPGGDLSTARCVLEVFTGPGELLASLSPYNERVASVWRSQGVTGEKEIRSETSIAWNEPVLVWVDGATKSAAEWVAGVIQTQPGTSNWVLGSTTFGKGILVSYRRARGLLDPTAPVTLGRTEARIKIRGHWSYHLRGIHPDFKWEVSDQTRLPLREADLERGLAQEEIVPEWMPSEERLSKIKLIKECLASLAPVSWSQLSIQTLDCLK